ncbi:MAG: hypothetical protein ACREVX_12675 [Clostridium sp.]|uniref:hypothetical protein n=1 Tax=Clostridium sp. TaxID=1506 RepID=UPI003D6D5F43
MVISYPTHYIVSAMPIISLDEDDYITKGDDYLLRSDEYSIQDNLDENEVYNTSRHVNIFEEIDQEYVNKTLNII